MFVSLSLLIMIFSIFVLYIPIFVISYKIKINHTKYKVKPLYQFNWNKILNPFNNSPSIGKYKID